MTRVNNTTPTDRIPSPLMGEESKVRVNKSKPTNPLSLDERGPKPVPVPDTGAEGEIMQSLQRVIPAQAGIHRVDVSWPSYWLQGSIHRACGLF